jgi:hypothetical protein
MNKRITRTPIALGLSLCLSLSLALTTGAQSQEATPKEGEGPGGQPRLFEPYNPKASGKAPEGWEMKILEGSQVENTTVLEGKKEIKVTVPAYELVPSKIEGVAVITDPGFDPKLATAQKETIGAILTLYSEEAVELQEKLEKVTAALEKEMQAGGIEKPGAEGAQTTPTQSQGTKPEATPNPEKKPSGNDKKKPSNSSR